MADEKKSLVGQLKSAGFLGELWQQLRLVYYLMRDRDVPLYLKALPLAGLLYVLFPLDLITDLVPVLGQFDDLMIVTIGAKVFIEMAPSQVVAKYTAMMRGESAKVIDSTASDVERQIKTIEGGAADAPDA